MSSRISRMLQARTKLQHRQCAVIAEASCTRVWAMTLHKQSPGLCYAYLLSLLALEPASSASGWVLRCKCTEKGGGRGRQPTRGRTTARGTPSCNRNTRLAQHPILSETHTQLYCVRYQRHAAMQAHLCKRCTDCKELQGKMLQAHVPDRVAFKKAKPVPTTRALR